MSGRFRLSTKACEDLDAILDYYLAEAGPDVASRVAEEFERAFMRLADQPGIGRLRTDLTSEPLRTWLVFKYLVLYVPESQPLAVVRVIHAQRDFLRLLDDLSE